MGLLKATGYTVLFLIGLVLSIGIGAIVTAISSLLGVIGIGALVVFVIYMLIVEWFDNSK